MPTFVRLIHAGHVRRHALVVGVGRLREPAVPHFVRVLDVDAQTWIQFLLNQLRQLRHMVVVGKRGDVDPVVDVCAVAQIYLPFVGHAAISRRHVGLRARRPTARDLIVGPVPVHEAQDVRIGRKIAQQRGVPWIGGRRPVDVAGEEVTRRLPSLVPKIRSDKELAARSRVDEAARGGRAAAASCTAAARTPAAAR